MTETRKTKTVWRCKVCGSAEILQDAFVGLNDPTDIRTCDDLFCEECEESCRVVECEEPV